MLGFGLLLLDFETPVDSLRTSFGLTPLVTRRKIAHILLLHKLVNGAQVCLSLDCPDLLPKIEFRITHATSSREIFFKRSYSYLYSHHSCMPCLMRERNEVAEDNELFASSLEFSAQSFWESYPLNKLTPQMKLEFICVLANPCKYWLWCTQPSR